MFLKVKANLQRVYIYTLTLKEEDVGCFVHGIILIISNQTADGLSGEGQPHIQCTLYMLYTYCLRRDDDVDCLKVS